MPTRIKDAQSSQEKIKTSIESDTLPPEELLTTNELMRFLKVDHRKTIYKLIGRGLPKIVVGHEYRFIKYEVLRFLKTQSQGRKAKDGVSDK